jgi:RNA polymerase sigma-70 factor (ECF subfamily)
MPRLDAPARAVTDARLIAASLEQPTDFAGLFDRHYGELAGYLGRRVGASLADELASETFVAAFAARRRYDAEQADARPWLYGIANNLLRKHARSENRRRRAYARSIERETVTSDTESAERRADAAALAPAVAAAIGRLPEVDRDALLLFALTDLDYAGIAVATGAPIGTVRSRIHRARRTLIAELGASTHTATERNRA